MTQTLSIARKLLSWKQRYIITNAAEEPIYEATWRFAWFVLPWVITSGATEVATIRRKMLTWVPTWNVHAAGHDFQLRQRVFSMRRRTYVVGGPFDGAELTGTFLGMNFRIEQGDQLVAAAAARLLTMRGRHDIEMHKTDSDAQLLTALFMVNLMMQKGDEESASQDRSSNDT